MTPPRILPGGTEPDLAAGRAARRRRPRRPGARGRRRARRGGPRRASAARSCALGAARLAAGDADDLAALVPEYVTLPRGVRAAPRRRRRGDAWSRDGAGDRASLRIRADAVDDLPVGPAHRARVVHDARGRRTPTGSELETNRLAHYLVARVGGEVVAYGGIWLMVDEAHVTTFAVHPAVAAPADRRAAAPGAARPRGRPPRARGHARGPAVEPRGAAAVREVRLPPGRPPAALLQRRRRGRADHDHGAARERRDARADRAAAGGARRAPAPSGRPGRRRRARGAARRRAGRDPSEAVA